MTFLGRPTLSGVNFYAEPWGMKAMTLKITHQEMYGAKKANGFSQEAWVGHKGGYIGLGLPICVDDDKARMLKCRFPVTSESMSALELVKG
jgi:hypothetical protein